MSRSGFYKWLKSAEKPYRYSELLATILQIRAEDKENENYGVNRMFEALQLKSLEISRSTVGRVMRANGLTLKCRRNPQSLTKADKAAQKAENLINGDFSANEPNRKLITDITQLKCLDGKLYISGVFDCFDLMCVGLSMNDNMRADLVIDSFKQAAGRFDIHGAISHSDRGSQYTSEKFKLAAADLGLVQSMNSAGGRCHDNARCESVWARFKVEAIYDKVDTRKLTMEEVKTLVFRYFMSYWNNRRICSSIGGVPPAIKRRMFDEAACNAA